MTTEVIYLKRDFLTRWRNNYLVLQINRQLIAFGRCSLFKQAIDDGFVQHDGQPRYAGASVLLARENFGCGSSREHAPWALEDFGFRAVIAPSFADIFYNNSFKNGLLPITLDEAIVDRLFKETEASEGYQLTVDLENKQVVTPSGEKIPFEVDDFRRHCLLNGLDDIGLTLQDSDVIKEYESQRRVSSAWLFQG